MTTERIGDERFQSLTCWCQSYPNVLSRQFAYLLPAVALGVILKCQRNLPFSLSLADSHSRLTATGLLERHLVMVGRKDECQILPSDYVLSRKYYPSTTLGFTSCRLHDINLNMEEILLIEQP